MPSLYREMSTSRRWLWCILVVSLLLFISLEAATADGQGGGNGGSGKGGGEGQGNDHGGKGNNGNNNNNNNDGQHNDNNNGGQNNDNNNGGQNNDHNGKNGGGDNNGKNGGDNNDNNGKNGDKNKQPPPSPLYPPPSLTPPSYPPPALTPPSYPPPSLSPPPSHPPPSLPPQSSPPPSPPLSSPPPPPSKSPPPPPSSSPPPPPSQSPPSPPLSSPPPPPLSSPPPPPLSSPPPPPSQSPPSPPLSSPPPPPPPSQSPPSPPLSSPPPPSPPPPSKSPPSLPPPLQSPPTPSPPPNGDSTDYYLLSPEERTGQERAFCTARGACFWQNLTCPSECPHRKPKDNKMKGCFIDCSSKCEASCKWRKPQCDGYGSLCYDPRFVGGDGVMFYFHGTKGSDFAIVSDNNLQINAHFVGTRPTGRTRDFTWVQALSIMFDTHTLILAAKRVSKWDDKVEALIVKWDNEMISIPSDGEAEWRINTENNRVVVVERTDDFNTVRATISGLVQVDVKVTPIGEQENKVHNYQIPADDAFAHLETQFKFFKLSNFVEGVLGKTYQPGYESPVKMGVPMPLMGGENKYQTPSLNSPLCKLCRFQRPSISMFATI